ncbi:MAG: c-type cytochrome domain-containing protein [Kofleriaceae bacterium]
MRALVLLAALAGGCLDAVGPDVGPPLRASCDDADRDPAVAVSFRRDLLDGVFASVTHGCLACHTAGGSSPIGLTVGGLDLGSYAGLRRGGVQSGADIVVPGRPCESVLYQKVRPGPPYGARMPLDGPPYVSAAEQDLIHDWIAEGAHAD